MNNTIYYGGCWATNLGNAFIDYGALHLCEKYNPHIYSEWDYFLFPNCRQNYFNTFVDLKPKCVFFSGMVLCPEFISDQKEIFKLIDQYKIPVILNGVGGWDYSRQEINTFREFIKQHNFKGFISRDDDSYEAYYDLFPKSYKGLDCAFFISEIEKYKFLNSCDKKYTVFNDLDLSKSPLALSEYNLIKNDNNTVWTYHRTAKAPESYSQRPRTMLSEMPDEYIYLYGLSKMVYTGRVHACIVTLSLGGKCILLNNTPRSAIFKTVGCGDITRVVSSIQDRDAFDKRKQIHRDGLKEIMKDIYV